MDVESDYDRRNDRTADKGRKSQPIDVVVNEKLLQAERQKMTAFMLVAFLVGILFAKWFLY